MISVLIMTRDAVLSLILGWLSVGATGPTSASDAEVVPGLLVTPVGDDRCGIDKTPAPEGA